MQEIYNHKFIEKKHQDNWLKQKTFHANETSTKPKYYCLSMFAYPSGKLHMGHVRNYTIGDVLARYHRFNQYNVLQPFGWDAFGLPAENAAIQNKVAPAKWTYQNIDYMRWQLQSLGLAVDWSREFATCSPDYYKWQQWLFIQLYKQGLIYKKNGIVNWDPVDQTVLANEQVIDGKGWRSGATVIKKDIPMYYFKISAFAEELLSELDNLPGWPEQVKTMQKNWIGKSTGLELTFPYTDNRNLDVRVFTTRADTLMGVTFIAVSNEHPLASLACELNATLKPIIAKYNQGGVSEAELATQEKHGVFSGLYVRHPLTNENIPVWIANYVLANYGTGAVMGVPAHCQRDFEFAKKYNLEIKLVVNDKNQLITHATDLTAAIATEVEADNLLINSHELNGLNYQQACAKIHQILSPQQLSSQKINYRLRDWGISRQRYWGCPIPIIHCDNCGDVLAEEESLPVVLPEEIIPDGNGSPLIRHQEFLHTTCPNCKAVARRETDTMDTFVDSSWYYARYTSADANNRVLDERANYWLAVDQYIGGIEHAILHLLYARFFHKCLKSLGLVASSEPFSQLLTQGMVLADTFYTEDNGRREWFNPADVACKLDDKGKVIAARLKKDQRTVNYGGMEKMSKSKNNGVDPQFIIEKYGADTARLFMMFAAPPELSLEWSDNGLEGANRFIRRLWRIVYEHISDIDDIASIDSSKYITQNLSPEQIKLEVQLNQTIAKVTKDIGQRKQFNTAIASIMELLNSYAKVAFTSEAAKIFRHQLLKHTVILLAPIIPHVCEELWSILCPNSTDINTQQWPSSNQDLMQNANVEIVVQINGKLRAKLLVAKDTAKEELERIALENDNVKKFVSDTSLVKKMIVVANKLVNIVI